MFRRMLPNQTRHALRRVGNTARNLRNRGSRYLRTLTRSRTPATVIPQRNISVNAPRNISVNAPRNVYDRAATLFLKNREIFSNTMNNLGIRE